MGTYTARTAVEPTCRRRRGPATVNSHRHGASNSGDINARKRTEGPGREGRNGKDLSEAGEEGSRRHAREVRLRPHTRGAAFGGRSPAADRRDERRATRPCAGQWPPRAYRQPSGPTRCPELAWCGPHKARTTWELMAGECNVQGAGKVSSSGHPHQKEIDSGEDLRTGHDGKPVLAAGEGGAGGGSRKGGPP